MIVVFFFQVADALRHVASMTARLNASLSCAWRPASVTVEFSLSAISWLHLLRGLPLPLLPSTIPSYMSLSRHSCLLTCPKYFSFRRMMSFCSQFSGESSSSRMEMFVLLSVQGTLKILRQHLSSNAFIFFSASLFILHVSDPYVAIGKIRDLINFSLVSLLLPFHSFFPLTSISQKR